MRAKFGRDPTAGSKKVSFKFIIGLYKTLDSPSYLHFTSFKHHAEVDNSLRPLNIFRFSCYGRHLKLNNCGYNLFDSLLPL